MDMRAAPATIEPDLKTPAVAWLGLAILMALYLLSFLDKQMLSLLLNVIGEDLHLSDVRLGLLTGIAFSLTYSLGVLATGWAVDRYSPRLIVFCGVILWSLAAAGGGLANSFEGLFLSRALVGLGEAALPPAAIAILATLFPRHRLSLASGIYHAGANIGGLLALSLGGATIGALISNGGMTIPVIGYAKPWQAAFILTGLPGLVLAFLIFGIRPRHLGPRMSRATRQQVPLLGYLRQHRRFFTCYYLATAMLGVVAYTLISWSPAYFGRAFGWSHEAIGVTIGAGVAMGGIGNILWGAIAGSLQRRGIDDAVFRVFATITLLGIPVAVAAFTTSSPTLVIILYAITWLMMNSWGAFIAALQLAIPDSLRGRTTGLQILTVGLFGIGLAPLIVGAITDRVLGGKELLGYAIAITVAGAGAIAGIAMLVGRAAFARIVAAQASARAHAAQTT